MLRFLDVKEDAFVDELEEMRIYEVFDGENAIVAVISHSYDDFWRVSLIDPPDETLKMRMSQFYTVAEVKAFFIRNIVF